MPRAWLTKKATERQHEPDYGSCLPISLELKYLDVKGKTRHETIYYKELEALRPAHIHSLINKINTLNSSPLLTEYTEQAIEDLEFEILRQKLNQLTKK